MRGAATSVNVVSMIEHLADDLGVILRRDLAQAGINDTAIGRFRRSGVLVRMRHGVYALAQAWTAADEYQRHMMLSRGVMTLYGDDVALSHTSAALTYGAPGWRVPTDLVHLTDLYSAGERVQARVRHHQGVCSVHDISRRDRHWITSPLRTALDAAAILDRDPAVCVLDWFLRNQLTTADELAGGLARREVWPDHLSLVLKVDHARFGSDSVGESRTRLLLGDLGLPEPVLQLEIHDADGVLIGKVDFAWPEHGVVLEFDGQEKYHRFRRPGETIEQMVLREKRREDRIREATGWIVIRISWADLANPAALLARLGRHLRPSAA